MDRNLIPSDICKFMIIHTNDIFVPTCDEPGEEEQADGDSHAVDREDPNDDRMTGGSSPGQGVLSRTGRKSLPDQLSHVDKSQQYPAGSRHQQINRDVRLTWTIVKIKST